jgi:hypothetical protein
MNGWKGPREAREMIRITREKYLDAHPERREAKTA